MFIPAGNSALFVQKKSRLMVTVFLLCRTLALAASYKDVADFFMF